MCEQNKVETLQRQVADLEARLAELTRRLPAHSIPPAMVAEMDELDVALAEARAELALLNREG
jgi:hypothetical protein